MKLSTTVVTRMRIRLGALLRNFADSLDDGEARQVDTNAGARSAERLPGLYL